MRDGSGCCWISPDSARCQSMKFSANSVIEPSPMADEPGSDEFRAVVEELARFCCDYCRYPQKYVSEDRLPLDHIIPRSRGDQTELGNTALCCHGCNGHKYDHVEGIDPETGQRMPLFHPRRQRWGDHF